MDEYFKIPIVFEGQEMEFEAKLLFHGYTYRVEVIINEIPVLFEPDEERNFRGLITQEQLNKSAKTIKIGLLQSIAHVLESLKED
jgi:hypothetical protein